MIQTKQINTTPTQHSFIHAHSSIDTIESAGSETQQPQEEAKSMRKPTTPTPYTIHGKLGKGSFGEVFLVSTNESTLHALKVLSKKKMVLMNSKGNVVNEVHILRGLDHPYISKLHSVYQSPQDVNILMDYCPGIKYDQEENFTHT
jgi:serine/threonine protein kinase